LDSHLARVDKHSHVGNFLGEEVEEASDVRRSSRLQEDRIGARMTMQTERPVRLASNRVLWEPMANESLF